MTADPDARWKHVLPALTRTSVPEDLTVPVHVPHGSTVVVVVADAAGHEEFLLQIEDNTPPREVDGVLTGRARFALGALAPGRYTLRATLEDGGEATGDLVVDGPEPAPDTPADEPRDPRADVGREEYHGRNWGISTALYAMRSTCSWGIGDFADLADVAVVAAGNGADYVLVRPVVSSTAEAVERLGLTVQEQAGFVVDPVYVRPEDIREVAYLPTSQRTMLEWGSESIRPTNAEADPIDVDAVWEAKRAALELIHDAPRSPMRARAFQRFTISEGKQLAPYVHAAVAAETPDPAATFDALCADTTAGAAARREYAGRIGFHLWLQWVGRQQLNAAHAAAREAGMRIGLVHTVAAATAPALISSLATSAGGVLITGGEGADDVAAAAEHEGLLVFRDTGEALARTGDDAVVPATTLWREFDDVDPRPVEEFPPGAMVSVTTIDAPPTAGVLAEEHLETMQRLGVLSRPYEELRQEERVRRERLLARVRGLGLITDGATERQLVEGLHRYLAHTPARFITITLSDAVGNRRPFVLGGTYPDWQYPFTDGAGTGVLVDQLGENPRFNSLVEALDAELRGA